MTDTTTDTERVSDYETATCPACEVRYGRHDDGDCPQCGHPLAFAPDYAALLVAGYEGIVRRLAREHAPTATAQFAVCAMCVETTPLARENASDVPKANTVEETIADAEAAIEALGDDDPYWVHGELADAYIEAYRAACVAPADCMVCTDAARDGDIECGHTRYGDACPAH